MSMRSIEFAASAARTTSADGTPVEDVHFDGPAAAYLDVTAVSGSTPTLDVKIQEYDPKSGQWYDVATFAQITAVGRERVAISALPGLRYRATWTIAGTTPSFTFSVSMSAKR